jgi:hypothetical protein
VKKPNFVCVAVLAGVLLTGCPIGPSSRLYKPISEWESHAFSKANREVYPNDVRKNFVAYDSARIAWPGVVLSADLRHTDSSLELHFVVEHHYYDWIEDFSIQREHIFLSPQGEGKFETIWELKPTADTTCAYGSVGNMVIVYGIPSSIKDSVISVRAYYIRVIDRQWFATDIMDYGRPNDPNASIKVLRVPK